ncbi:hypothetical protein DL93DRAFT_2167357 [Clavulina sp. PMI_390]|nr:hypothetical protein DL93DRAFT_2167357 [Clavulina sp. PMI_390]
MAPPPQRNIAELVFDVGNPFCYIALVTLVRYRHTWNLELDLSPVFSPHLYDATGDGQPIPMELKRLYHEHDIMRMAEQWGVAIRRPQPASVNKVTTLQIMNFLRIVKESESMDTLVACTITLYEEIYGQQTPIDAPTFYHCLTKATPTTPNPPLTRKRLQKLLGRSRLTPKAEDAMKGLAKHVWEKRQVFSMPFTVVWAIPRRVEDRDADEKRDLEAKKQTRESDVFWGCDRFEFMAWFLGPEYAWCGPWPDGQDRSGAHPNVPSPVVDFVYPQAKL